MNVVVAVLHSTGQQEPAADRVRRLGSAYRILI